MLDYAYQDGYDNGYRKGYADGMDHLQEMMTQNILDEAAVIKIDRRLDGSEIVRQIQEKLNENNN